MTEEIREVIEMYQKHGWNLSRVLFSKTVVREFFETEELIEADLKVEQSEIDALWFTRGGNKGVTWELRLLSGSPFALCQTFSEDVPEVDLNSVLSKMEKQASERVKK